MADVTALALGIDSRPAKQGAEEFERAVGKAVAAAVNADGRLRDAQGRFVALGQAEQAATARTREFAAANGQLGTGIGGNVRNLAAMTLGVGSLGLVLFKGVQHFKNFINEADHLHDLSARFDLPVETLSILGEEAKLAGGSLDQVAKGLSKLAIAKQQALGDLKGKSQASQGFAALGIDPKEFGRDADGLQQLFERVAHAIRDLGDTAEKEDLAKRLLGRTGAELIPFLEEFEGFAGKSARHSKEAADAADRWNDSVQNLGKSFDLLLGRLTPAIDKLAELVEKLSGNEGPGAAVRPMSQQFEDLVVTLGRARLEAESAEKALNSIQLRSLFEPPPPEFLAALEKYKTAMQAVAKATKEVNEFPEEKRFAPKQFQATGTELRGTESRAQAVQRLTTLEQSFIDKLLAEAQQLRLTGFEAEAFRIRQEALAQGLDVAGDKAKTFKDSLDGALRTLREASAISQATASIESLAESIQKVGKTEAEIREIDFDRMIRLSGAAGTEVARLRGEFERLNEELERTQNAKIFDDQVRALSNEVRLAGLLTDEREQEAAVLQLIEATHGRITLEQADQIRALVRARQETERLRDLGQEFADGITHGLEEALIRMEGFRDIALSAFQDIERAALRAFLIQPLNNALSGLFGGGLLSLFGSANGNVFGPGRGGPQVIPFSSGGVFSSPLMFPMAGGRRGIMAENGPEAVMPLERGSDGKLGVRSKGGGATTNIMQMTVYANDAGSFRRSNRQIMGNARRYFPTAA